MPPIDPAIKELFATAFMFACIPAAAWLIFGNRKRRYYSESSDR